MSIDINVFIPKAGKKLRERWQAALADHGMNCEFRPDFDPETWEGGDFLVRMEINPNGFPGAEKFGAEPFLTGCGLDLYREGEFDDEQADAADSAPSKLKSKVENAKGMYYFYTSAGRSAEAWRIQIYAAATLALITKGVLHDPQSAKFYYGAVILEMAKMDTYATERSPSRQRKENGNWNVKPFSTWKTALKGSIATIKDTDDSA